MYIGRRYEMSTATERFPVLLTKDQKLRLHRKAKGANLTMGEFLRQAAERFQPEEDSELLEQLATEVVRSTKRAIQSIDETLKFVAASEKRLRRTTSLSKSRM
jgi:hypothetical protein